MIWLSWRQQRFETALALAGLGAGAALLLLTHRDILATLDQLGIPRCLRNGGGSAGCVNAFSAFRDNVRAQQTLINWLGYLPLLLGVLLAAPIALEMEQGGYRLSWTQSVTRARWTIIRLGLPLLVGLGVVAVVAELSSWWMSPLNRVEGPLRPGEFELQGIVPMGYLLLAFAITVFVGVIWRRALPALGTGLAAGIGLQVIIGRVRPNFISPITKIWIKGPAPFSRRDWVTQGGSGSNSFIYADPVGHRFSAEQIQTLCGQVSDAKSKATWSRCMRVHHIGELIQFQPPTRFWEFQTIETMLVAGIAVMLLAAAVWWLQKRTY